MLESGVSDPAHPSRRRLPSSAKLHARFSGYASLPVKSQLSRRRLDEAREDIVVVDRLGILYRLKHQFAWSIGLSALRSDIV